MSHNDIDDYERRKSFLEDLKTLNKLEQQEIFRILKKNSSLFSENSNGIFFDVSRIDTTTFLQLLTFIEFCKKNNQDFESREQEQQKAADSLNVCGSKTEHR